MKNIKKAYIILGTTILSISAFTGCNKPENNCSLVSTFSSSIINANKAIVARDGYAVDLEIGLNEGQAIDREGATEIEGANGTSEDIELPGEIVEGTALTQEEIDQLKASAKDIYQEGIEAYQQIMEEGSWEVPGQGGQSIISEVVGKPGDTSWRQMTDEEARAYMEEKPGSQIGKAELNAGTWNKLFNGKLYFNPYEYEKDAKAFMDKIPGFTEDDIR